MAGIGQGAAEADFRVLGDIAVQVGDRPVAVGYSRLRCVLAVLLIEANRAVSADQLIDRVWGDQRLPAHPRNAVHYSMSMLRNALADVPGVAISRQATGYQITLDSQFVDVHRFQDLVEQARGVDDVHALTMYEQAFELWRGEPCAGVDTPWFSTFRASLVERHHAARLDYNDLLLRCGRHTQLVTGLRSQVGQHPLDERLAGQYMLALYRSGRQAEALAHHQYIRGQLIEQLGTDPSPPLQELHQRILAADPALATPAGRSEAKRQQPPVPRQLPAPPRLFAGRAEELAQLTALLAGQSGTAVMLSVIRGSGGIGKTWLALRWAHEHLDRFPDGQIYLNLRGFDPTGSPMDPETAIRTILAGLGADPGAVPADLAAQTGLYRSLADGKRLLIVLDNAADADQVTPLLPGSPACTVLVTSRHRLNGLVASHGATAVDLDVLADTAAKDLLARHLGQSRLAEEPDAVSDLVRHCGGLPLALGIVAARVTGQPGFPLAALADELRDRTCRLNAFDAGDLTTNLRAVLSWSCHSLSKAARTVFRLLGLVPGPDISLSGVTCLIDLPADQARVVIRELVDAHLVQQHAPDRYRMHDLIRLYAADSGHPAKSARAALRRLADHYLHTAVAAEQLLDPPPRPQIQLSRAAAGSMPVGLSDQTQALAWFDAEHANLMAIQRLALDQGWHTQVWQLSWTLDVYHYRRGYLTDALVVWQAALTAAERVNDSVTQTLAHRRIGYACARVGRHDEALDHLQRALALTELAGDRSGQAHNHYILARAWEQQGDYQLALHHADHALSLYQSLDQPARAARVLGAAAGYHARLGQYEPAYFHAEAAFVLFRQHNDRDGEGSALTTLGQVAHSTGRHAEALEHYRQALAVFRDLGNTYYEAETLGHLGATYEAVGQLSRARATWHQALRLYRVLRHTTDAGHIQRNLRRLDAVTPENSRA
ncbi:DNA-binding SARP family transcriptional activator/tetratricopeptide (TPR) repeat protein [Kibdelosporangium banguiense]|uniref:DNA-binding SARP family transcriptional activator/tetratricopeptide (TPR) repeat protein n=1 Tax=Kibdelosporangium banguiense TaxID=1365924 RepID=A0ABS4TUB5_9PSEU|nr:BTAD domain-containing putative transcriptional regulator [Kibdelosporangium banguiense]MBP2327993.1 DNA-binding SARP family transcriptional activator/tetratricopeptide (TPR) repeat protein [Kibdelosporangium banguiense]